MACLLRVSPLVIGSVSVKPGRHTCGPQLARSATSLSICNLLHFWARVSFPTWHVAAQVPVDGRVPERISNRPVCAQEQRRASAQPRNEQVLDRSKKVRSRRCVTRLFRSSECVRAARVSVKPRPDSAFVSSVVFVGGVARVGRPGALLSGCVVCFVCCVMYSIRPS